MSGSDAPIFVVGVARSGTTLLSAMLSAHHRLDCGPESRFFARLRHLDDEAVAGLLDPTDWPARAVEFIAALGNQGHPILDLFDLSGDDVRAYLSDRPPSIATSHATLSTAVTTVPPRMIVSNLAMPFSYFSLRAHHSSTAMRGMSNRSLIRT